MSPWYSWRASPGSTAKGLTQGDLEMPAQWYQKSLDFYRKYTRSKVADHLKKEMTKYYTRCPQAWYEVLALKGTTPAAVQSGRRSSGSAKPPVDEDIPDYDY
jgi:hypothetical protein